MLLTFLTPANCVSKPSLFLLASSDNFLYLSICVCWAVVLRWSLNRSSSISLIRTSSLLFCSSCQQQWEKLKSYIVWCALKKLFNFWWQLVKNNIPVNLFEPKRGCNKSCLAWKFEMQCFQSLIKIGLTYGDPALLNEALWGKYQNL